MKKILTVFFIIFYSQAAFAIDVRLVFVGDIMTHIQQIEAASRSDGRYDFSNQFEKIHDFLSGDLVIGNFETTLAGRQRRFTGYPTFNTPDELADELQKVGFNVLLLANNHIYDKGTSGLIRTIEELESRGFSLTGAFRTPSEQGDHTPLLFDIKGIKIGIFNYSYGSNVPINDNMRATTHLNVINESSIRDDIKYLKDNRSDLIIATFHWGNEYQPQPSKRQREIAELCFSEGADMVVGTHPHILQPIEVFELNGRVIMAAYSLGNFVSFQRTLPRERSLILAVNVSKTASGDVSISNISAAPTYVQVKGSGKTRIVQVIPAPEKIENAVLDFLKIPKQNKNRGFYCIYDKDR
jgi:poly-gamma-glutamate synthesis protein (capsule biosynthesis protein)